MTSRLFTFVISIIFFAVCFQQSCWSEELTPDDEKWLYSIVEKVKKLTEEGEIEAAENEILKVRKRFPVQLSLALGDTYLNKRYYEEAKQEYEKVSEYDHTEARAHAQLSVIYLHLGNPQKALEEGKLAFEYNADYAGYHYLKSVMLAKDGNYEESIIAAKKAIEINPDYALFWFYLGELHKKMGNQDEALNAYLKAISQDDAKLSAESWATMLPLLFDKKEKAIELLEKYIKLHPDNDKLIVILDRLIANHPTPTPQT